MSKLTYIRCGDYDIPNLKLSEQPETSIGKYGRMRKSYLKEHRPIQLQISSLIKISSICAVNVFISPTQRIGSQAFSSSVTPAVSIM